MLALNRFCFFVLLWLCQLAHADLVAIPDLVRPVTDLTQTLTAEQQAALNTKLTAFSQQKGSQIAVLIVPSTQPEDIAQYAIRVAEQWQLGRKKIDDGVLLLVAKTDRKMRIEVGYGLEGAIPDVIAKRIISDVMTPYFKQGDYFAGIDAGVDQLIARINGEPLPLPENKAQSGVSLGSLFPFLLMGGLFSGLVLRRIFGTFLGSAFNGGIIGGLVFLIGVSLFGAGLLGLVAFVVTMMLGSRGINGYGGPYPTHYGGGFGGGDVFSGGGGTFGGGGASGSW